MSEQFLIETHGGPWPGARVVNTDAGYTWPLPSELYADGGHYTKVSESQLGPIPPNSHVIRGAAYKWQPSTE